MPVPELLGLGVLIVGVPLNLYVVMMLRRLRQEEPNPVLDVLLVLWVLVLIIAAIFGLIFVNNDTVPPPLDVLSTKIITRSIVLALVTVPAVSLIVAYRRS